MAHCKTSGETRPSFQRNNTRLQVTRGSKAETCNATGTKGKREKRKQNTKWMGETRLRSKGRKRCSDADCIKPGWRQKLYATCNTWNLARCWK